MSILTTTLRLRLGDGSPPNSGPATADAVRSKQPRLHRWTYEQFMSLWDLGVLGRRRVELIDGRIYRTAPWNDPHVGTVELVRIALAKCFGDGYWVRQQSPLQLGRHSAPERDRAVVVGGPRDYIGRGHPSTAMLVVEVSDTTLKFDRGVKTNLYASVGISEFSIVNVVDQVVQVHRSPIADPVARLKHRYASVETFAPPSTVSPLAAPTAPISVADLLR